jgi:hypothetical protein
VHLPGRRALLGFLPDDLGRELPEVAKHRRRQLENLDLPLELGLEPPQREGVLRLVLREEIWTTSAAWSSVRWRSTGSASYAFRSNPNSVTVPGSAAKHSSGGMSWPPGNTSIRNRPPLISSTTLPSRWAAPWSTSSAGVQVVDMRH